MLKKIKKHEADLAILYFLESKTNTKEYCGSKTNIDKNCGGKLNSGRVCGGKTNSAPLRC